MKERANLKSVIWAWIFSISFVISVFALSRYALPLPVTLLIIAINAVFFGVYAFKMIQSIGSMDEVAIRIHLEAVSVAFVLALLTVMVLGMAEIVSHFGFDKISFLYIFPLFFLFYFIGLFISKRKYR